MTHEEQNEAWKRLPEFTRFAMRMDYESVAKNPDLFPSRDLWLKYPTEPIKAWREWQEQRKLKPTWWRAKKGEEYWIVDITGRLESFEEEYVEVDEKSYTFGNYFRTADDAQQAAALIRETLRKFHESKSNDNAETDK